MRRKETNNIDRKELIIANVSHIAMEGKKMRWVKKMFSPLSRWESEMNANGLLELESVDMRSGSFLSLPLFRHSIGIKYQHLSLRFLSLSLYVFLPFCTKQCIQISSSTEKGKEGKRDFIEDSREGTVLLRDSITTGSDRDTHLLEY